MGEKTPMTAVKHVVGRVTSRVTTAFEAVTEPNTSSGPTPDEMRQSVRSTKSDDPREPQGIYKTVSPPPKGNTTLPEPVSNEDTDSQTHNDRGYFDRRPRDTVNDVSEADTTDTDADDTGILASPDPQDCDHDDWGKLPERRFELPGPAPRETYGVCNKCGITEYELDSD